MRCDLRKPRSDARLRILFEEWKDVVRRSESSFVFGPSSRSNAVSSFPLPRARSSANGSNRFMGEKPSRCEELGRTVRGPVRCLCLAKYRHRTGVQAAGRPRIASESNLVDQTEVVRHAGCTSCPFGRADQHSTGQAATSGGRNAAPRSLSFSGLRIPRHRRATPSRPTVRFLVASSSRVAGFDGPLSHVPGPSWIGPSPET